MRYDFERPLKELEDQLERITLYARNNDINMEAEIASLREKLADRLREICAGLTSYQRIQLARHLDRPNMMDYLERIAEDFVELHGDRAFRDDHAITAGLGKIDGLPVALLGHQKGHDTKENLECNFGMAHPEGFRKARRVMELADRFGLPIITFIDAAGAYPGDQAEERGQALVIAENLQAMAAMKVPIIACVTGEGGSGGALAIGVANRVLIFENAYYAVCTPEACASIILKDGSKAPEMVDNMRILARDLLEMGLVDEVMPEPLGGAHRDPDAAAATLKEAVLRHLRELLALSPEELREDRHRRFRRMGVFQETGR
ncbi:acetyl-CoA carboxylase carboxyltransferase subunit alpha [bacterium]|nr:acetyl-CoA carboxylase carboxyltransferase subunit alpha [bacterium]